MSSGLAIYYTATNEQVCCILGVLAPWQTPLVINWGSLVSQTLGVKFKQLLLIH